MGIEDWVADLLSVAEADRATAYAAFFAGLCRRRSFRARTDAEAVAFAFGSGFAVEEFDRPRAVCALDEMRERMEAERGIATLKKWEASATDAAEQETEEKPEAGARSASAEVAHVMPIATSLADYHLAGRHADGYATIAAIAEEELPATIAVFMGDSRLDGGEEGNFYRARNLNRKFARARGGEALRKRFSKFFGECCAGEHKLAMSRDWAKGVRTALRSSRSAEAEKEAGENA